MIRREASYDILINDTIIKVVRLIKMYLNNTYIKVRIGKQLYDKFRIQNGMKRDALLPLVWHLTLGRSKKSRSTRN